MTSQDPTADSAPSSSDAEAGNTFTLSTWPVRVAAVLVESLFYLPLLILMMVIAGATTNLETGESSGGGLMMLIYAATIAFWLYQLYLQGTTGSTWGKKIVGVAVVKESDAQPTGFLIAVVRAFAHLLDGIFYLGYLWPLWDKKRQTFADKLCSTVSIRTK